MFPQKSGTSEPIHASTGKNQNKYSPPHIWPYHAGPPSKQVGLMSIPRHRPGEPTLIAPFFLDMKMIWFVQCHMLYYILIHLVYTIKPIDFAHLQWVITMNLLQLVRFRAARPSELQHHHEKMRMCLCVCVCVGLFVFPNRVYV